jgi:MFS family permease
LQIKREVSGNSDRWEQSVTSPTLQSANIDQNSNATPRRLTAIEWLICALACIGFAFDTYEVVVMSVVVAPAVAQLGHLQPGSAGFNHWVGLLFYVPAFAGGIFGLLGGYLTDRFGRKRVLAWSILLYALSAFCAGCVTSLAALLVLRCIAMIGVSVEFVAAVAWVAENFHEPQLRESILGYTQAFSVAGSLLVTAAYYVFVTYGNRLPAAAGTHEAWRYALMFGLIPALPLILIRPFVPESPLWRELRSSRTNARPSIRELFQPALRTTTVVTTIIAACTFALAYGAIHHVPRIVPGLAQVRVLPPKQQQQIVSQVHLFDDFGNLAGRLIFAFLVVRIASQRRLLRAFLLPALMVFPFVFLYAAQNNLRLLEYCVALAVAMMVAQFSFWGNYLPRVYPTNLRGTGESFAANIGGRMLGSMAALLTTQLALAIPGSNSFVRVAHAAGAVAFIVCCAALLVSFWLPEPTQELPI